MQSLPDGVLTQNGSLHSFLNRYAVSTTSLPTMVHCNGVSKNLVYSFFLHTPHSLPGYTWRGPCRERIGEVAAGLFSSGIPCTTGSTHLSQPLKPRATWYDNTFQQSFSGNCTPSQPQTDLQPQTHMQPHSHKIEGNLRALCKANIFLPSAIVLLLLCLHHFVAAHCRQTTQRSRLSAIVVKTWPQHNV